MFSEQRTNIETKIHLAGIDLIRPANRASYFLHDHLETRKVNLFNATQLAIARGPILILIFLTPRQVLNLKVYGLCEMIWERHNYCYIFLSDY